MSLTGRHKDSDRAETRGDGEVVSTTSISILRWKIPSHYYACACGSAAARPWTEEDTRYFLQHRRDVILRRTRYELRKAEERAHILEGLKIALDHLDEIIA